MLWRDAVAVHSSGKLYVGRCIIYRGIHPKSVYIIILYVYHILTHSHSSVLAVKPASHYTASCRVDRVAYIIIITIDTSKTLQLPRKCVFSTAKRGVNSALIRSTKIGRAVSLFGLAIIARTAVFQPVFLSFFERRL